ncbi:MAG: hypothetical protein ACWA6Y_06520 [Polaromonas sp.]
MKDLLGSVKKRGVQQGLWQAVGTGENKPLRLKTRMLAVTAGSTAKCIMVRCTNLVPSLHLPPFQKTPQTAVDKPGFPLKVAYVQNFYRR